MKKILIVIFTVFCGIVSYSRDALPKTRPDPEKGPTKVYINLYVMDIESINNKKQTFDIDFIIRYRWHDERLRGSGGIYPLSSVWYPNIQIYNLQDVETRFPKIVKVTEDGTVDYTQRYYATLRAPLDFKDFPYDEQKLPITLLAFGSTPDEIKFVFEKAGGSEKFSISDWEIIPEGVHISVEKANVFDDADGKKILRPRLDYVFKSKRYIHFYLWKVLAPLVVILFLSWAVFWIDPSQVGAQIGVSGTSILTLIAFLYKLDNILPPVAYLTHMDYFIYTSLLLVFLAYLEALTSTSIALRGKKELALKLDFVFRIVYPFLFLIVLLVYWF